MSHAKAITVLLIQDDEADALLVQRALAKAGSTRFEVTHVSRLSEALAYLATEHTDIALLELGLPDAHGTSGIPRLVEKCPAVPIIVLTGCEDEELESELIQLGARDCLVKGETGTRSLRRSIRYAMERQRMMLALESEHKELAGLINALKGASTDTVCGTKTTSEIIRSIDSRIVEENERLVLELERSYTELEKSRQIERRLARHDTLTDLPNRQSFYERLGQAIAQVKRNNQQAAVLFLDLDEFKRVNDTLGHGAGDSLLQAVADRLKRVIRTSDTVCRLGGDEFTIVLADVSKAQDVARVAQKVLNAFSDKFLICGHEIFVSTSIGIALYPADGAEVEALVRNADIAMYGAKKQGKNSYQFYDKSLEAVAFERLALETELRQALENEELVVHYQPHSSLKTGRVSGVEALVRWQHPKLGLLGPGKFIQIAEDTGLIVPIGEWVLRTACNQNKAWQDAGLPPVRISVNVSSRQFRGQELVETVPRILQETGLQPEYLGLEITESSAMENVDYTASVLRALKGMGIQILFDDFGTGYSSLSYLQQFPLDILKIDLSFVRNIPEDKNNVAITSAIIAIARSLGLQTIAEGVETEEQREFLRSLGCDEMQGFLFSRPVPPDELEKLWRDGVMDRYAAKVRP